MGRILGILEWNNWQKRGNNKLKPTSPRAMFRILSVTCLRLIIILD